MAGVGITGSLLNPGAAHGAKLNTKGQKVKIGILLPQSNENPLFPGAFLSGLRSGMDQHNVLKRGKIELITESVHFGTPVIVKEKTQKLISENNVDMVVGILNPEVATHVGNIFSNAKLPAIIANAGESYPVNEIKENRFLFFNGLNLYQAAYHTGQYAVEKFGKNIAVVTSFYDSGYDSLFTFRQGVESAGGNPPETIMAAQDTPDFTSGVVEKLRELKPDAVYLFAHGKTSDDLIRNLYFSNLDIPVFASAFSTEEDRLLDLGGAAQNILSVRSWNRNLRNEENQKFVQKYVKQWNKTPNLFSLLGYETGQLVYASLSECSGDYSGDRIAHALQHCSFNSPRGKVFVNKKSGVVYNRLMLNKTVMSPRGIPENEVLETFEPVDEFEEKFALLDNDYRSGWLNPYLFV